MKQNIFLIIGKITQLISSVSFKHISTLIYTSDLYVRGKGIVKMKYVHTEPFCFLKVLITRKYERVHVLYSFVEGLLTTIIYMRKLFISVYNFTTRYVHVLFYLESFELFFGE